MGFEDTIVGELVLELVRLVVRPTLLVGPRIASTLIGLVILVTIVTVSRVVLGGVDFFASPATIKTVVPDRVIFVDRELGKSFLERERERQGGGRRSVRVHVHVLYVETGYKAGMPPG